MNKQKLIQELLVSQGKRGVSKAAIEEIVQSIFAHLTHTLCRKKKFSYQGFGSFVVRNRRARQARNPKTGEWITISSRRTVLFRPSKNVKLKINSKD